ncbi:hypothetical protein CHS0354_033387 [Potamilus streckersoni]|uniref:C1q domain-containing protein n=1 Tax=Potamilus streckersoni TaxID=2493646 RepID=A0AAE0RTN5_9BIVA|nr:hypothetical protein CHS0354_033387 [Potamilus streckersoni]
MKSESLRMFKVARLDRLSYVDELEKKLHKAESRLSLVEELEAKLKAVEKILVKMNIERSDIENEDLSALSEAKHNKSANIHSKSGLPQEDRVAFSVSGSNNQEYEGFHMSTGTFICPRSGTYLFLTTLSSAGKGPVSSVIKIVGATKFQQYSAYGHPGDNMSTGAVVVLL